MATSNLKIHIEEFPMATPIQIDNKIINLDKLVDASFNEDKSGPSLTLYFDFIDPNEGNTQYCWAITGKNAKDVWAWMCSECLKKFIDE